MRVDQRKVRVDVARANPLPLSLLFACPVPRVEFVCPTEILSFSAAQSTAFAAINTQVLAISTDSVHTHLAWVRTAKTDGGLGKVDIPLVADTSKQISKSYGVLVEDDQDPMYGAALRGLFIIDPTGKVRSLTINDDQAGRNVDEQIRS